MTRPSVAVCIVTYRRPVGLARLLDRISALERDQADVTVLVIDNDPEGSAREVVAGAVGDLCIQYVNEPQRGITYARNTALDVALAGSPEWIVWLDDDEAPRPDWLRRVLATQSVTGADVVSGPSSPVFEPGAPTWLCSSGLFETGHFPTGAPYPYFHSRTSGVLVRSALVPVERFDNRLAIIGGEDRMFFTRMHRAGAKFVWDDDAVVDEWIPMSRTSVGWLTRRWFRTGVTRSLIMLYLDDPPWTRRLRRVGGGVLISLRGIGSTLLAVPRGRTEVLAASRGVSLGAGAVVGALGIRYEEYRKVHGV